MSGFSETVAQFGPERGLVGILTAPRGAADEVAVVVINTGITHRPGHHRTFVQWARGLAQAGHAVLRFDLSGIGDSAGVTRGADPLAAAQADLRDAIDWMGAHGHARIALLGICAGADQAIAYAGTDERVRGVVLIDPTLPTLRNIALARWRRVARYAAPQAIVQLPAMMLRQVRKLSRAIPRHGVLGAGPMATLSPPEVRPFLRRVYGEAIAGGVQLLAVLTADSATRRGSGRVFHALLPGLDLTGCLATLYLDGADHLLIRRRDRARVAAAMEDWLTGLRTAAAPPGEDGAVRPAAFPPALQRGDAA